MHSAVFDFSVDDLIPKGNWKQWLCTILGINKCLVVFEKMANSWNPPSLSKRGSCKNYVLSAKESCLYDKRNEKWDYTHIRKRNRAVTLFIWLHKAWQGYSNSFLCLWMKPEHATIKMKATVKLFILRFKVVLIFKHFWGSAWNP